jgi:hypothetical protein
MVRCVTTHLRGLSGTLVLVLVLSFVSCRALARDLLGPSTSTAWLDEDGSVPRVEADAIDSADGATAATAHAAPAASHLTVKLGPPNTRKEAQALLRAINLQHSNPHDVSDVNGTEPAAVCGGPMDSSSDNRNCRLLVAWKINGQTVYKATCTAFKIGSRVSCLFAHKKKKRGYTVFAPQSL